MLVEESRTSGFSVQELTRLFRSGTNLMQTLRDHHGLATNSETTILYSYDIQSGSYVEALKDPAYADVKKASCAHLASVIASLEPRSLLDAGTGEATTLGFVLKALPESSPTFAFDISLSRVLHAQAFLRDMATSPVSLFTSSLTNIALADGCCDVVFTSHACEPNGGNEADVLRELLRVTGRYLVLVEPSWELGSAATKAHIEKHGYVRGLPNMLRALGATVERHELWPFNHSATNEAALIVARSPGAVAPATPQFCSPIGRGALENRGSYYFSKQDGFAFPVIEGIPCLLAENGVLASCLEAAVAR